MAREEILDVLKELQDININTDELEDLNISKKIVENEIAKLEEKISDNSNYPVFDYINTRSKINNINKTLASLNDKIANNNTEIDIANINIALFNLNLEKINALVPETQQQLDDIGRKLRSLGEIPDKDLEKEYSENLQEKREILSNLTDELEVYEEDKKANLDNIEKLKDSNRQLTELISRYNKLKESLTEREKNKEGYDKSKKRLDENRLAELKSSLDAINNRSNYISDTSISELISDIENNNISDENINNRLSELRNSMPSDYIENFSNARENVKEKMDNLTMFISDLQTKLSDETNYTPSIFATEVYSDEIDDYESRIKSYDNEMSIKDLYIRRVEEVIDDINGNITIKENKIIELQARIDNLRFEMTDTSYSKQDLDSFTKEISKNKKEIENIRKQIERLNKNISTKETLISSLKKDKKEVENIKNADLKTLESLRATLDDRKTVDRVSIANDKKQLEVYLSERKLLESLEKFYSTEFGKLSVEPNNIVEDKDSVDKIIELQNRIDYLRIKINDSSYSKQEIDSFIKEIEKSEQEINKIRKELEINSSEEEKLKSLEKFYGIEFGKLSINSNDIIKNSKEVEYDVESKENSIDEEKVQSETESKENSIDEEKVQSETEFKENSVDEEKTQSETESKENSVDEEKIQSETGSKENSVDEEKTQSETGSKENSVDEEKTQSETGSKENSATEEENIEVVENTNVEEVGNEKNSLEDFTYFPSLESSEQHIDKLDDIEEPTFDMPETSTLASDISSSVINSVEPPIEPEPVDEKERVTSYETANSNLIEKSRNIKFISKVKEKLSAIRFSLAVSSGKVKKFVNNFKNKNNEPNSFDNNANLNTENTETTHSEDDLMEELNSYNPDKSSETSLNDLNDDFDYEPASSITIGEEGTVEDLFIRNLHNELFGEKEEPSMGKSR